jgi:hypothetical protein
VGPFFISAGIAMDPVKKLYAAIDYGVRQSTGTPVSDEKDAIEKTMSTGGISFRLYETTTVTVGGKELKGDPENFSPTCWVGVERVYSRDDIVQSYKDQMARTDKYMARSIQLKADHFLKKSPDTMHIPGTDTGRGGPDFVEIGRDDKVFDRKGQQLWPKPKPPVLRVTKPAKKIQLKPGP